MSRPQNLRHSVTSQVTEDMARSNIPSPLPSQNGLAEIYSINYTAIHRILRYLSACGVLILVGKSYVIARRPERNGGSDCITASLKEQDRLSEQAFFTITNLRRLHAGEGFSELQLV